MPWFPFYELLYGCVINEVYKYYTSSFTSCQDDGVPGAASTIDVTEMPAGSGQGEGGGGGGGGGGRENDLKLHVAEGVAEV